MDRSDFTPPRSAKELRVCASRAQKLALTAMDELTISRLVQLAREYEAEAISIESGENV
jgi:hypothetical protein